jgi:hypothetical protein
VQRSDVEEGGLVLRGGGAAADDANEALSEAQPNEGSAGTLVVPLTDQDRALLEEAMKLTGMTEPSAVLLIALKELVERQRFLSWVAAHDRKERSGTA